MTNSVIFQDQTHVPVGTSVGLAELDGEQLIRVVRPEENIEPCVPTYARLAGSDFHDGTIEVDVRARLMRWADVDCRGFIGIVFRASDANGRFEDGSEKLGDRISRIVTQVRTGIFRISKAAESSCSPF